jgi:hypothetical protein
VPVSPFLHFTVPPAASDTVNGLGANALLPRPAAFCWMDTSIPGGFGSVVLDEHPSTAASEAMRAPAMRTFTVASWVSAVEFRLNVWFIPKKCKVYLT